MSMESDMGIVWPVLEPYEEISVFPSVHADLLTDGGNVFLRLNVAHRVPGCNYSCSFPAAPSSVVMFNELAAEIDRHMKNCPKVQRNRTPCQQQGGVQS